MAGKKRASKSKRAASKKVSASTPPSPLTEPTADEMVGQAGVEAGVEGSRGRYTDKTDWVRHHLDKKPKAAVELAKQEGWEISAEYFSTTKSRLEKKAKANGRGRGRAGGNGKSKTKKKTRAAGASATRSDKAMKAAETTLARVVRQLGVPRVRELIEFIAKFQGEA